MAIPSAVQDAATGGGLSQGLSQDVSLLVAYVLMALVVSFLCSLAEAVLLSITPSWIEGLRENKPRRAALVRRLKQDDIDRSLAAILTLNTIAHTVGALGAGAQATVVFGSAWFGVFSALMTLLILFLSEIVPKTIGAVYWNRLVAPTAWFVNLLIVCLYPVVWIAEKLTRLIAGSKRTHLFSRTELVAMTRVGKQAGSIDENESQIIHNLFRLRSLTVKDIMTPRTVIAALPEETRVRDAIDYVSEREFSRLPVYRGGIDDIRGFVLRDDVLLKMSQGEGDTELRSFMRCILPVPESISVSLLLDRLLRGRQHIAVVIDEHGGTRGLVTLEDLLETLIGAEIMDEVDTTEDMRALARRLWRERARALGIDERV